MYISLQKIQVNNGQSVGTSSFQYKTNHSISTYQHRINSFFTTKASCSQIDQQPQIPNKRYKINSNACDTRILRVTENMYMQWQYIDNSMSDISNYTRDNY